MPGGVSHHFCLGWINHFYSNNFYFLFSFSKTKDWSHKTFRKRNSGIFYGKQRRFTVQKWEFSQEILWKNLEIFPLSPNMPKYRFALFLLVLTISDSKVAGSEQMACTTSKSCNTTRGSDFFSEEEPILVSGSINKAFTMQITNKVKSCNGYCVR